MDFDSSTLRQVYNLNWEEVSKLPPIFRAALVTLEENSPLLAVLRKTLPQFFVEAGIVTKPTPRIILEVARLSVAFATDDEPSDEDASQFPLIEQDSALCNLSPQDAVECSLYRDQELLAEVAKTLDGQTARWGMIVDTTQGRFLVGDLRLKNEENDEEDGLNVGDLIQAASVVYAFLYPAELFAGF